MNSKEVFWCHEAPTIHRLPGDLQMLWLDGRKDRGLWHICFASGNLPRGKYQVYSFKRANFHQNYVEETR